MAIAQQLKIKYFPIRINVAYIAGKIIIIPS